MLKSSTVAYALLNLHSILVSVLFFNSKLDFMGFCFLFMSFIWLYQFLVSYHIEMEINSRMIEVDMNDLDKIPEILKEAMKGFESCDDIECEKCNKTIFKAKEDEK